MRGGYIYICLMLAVVIGSYGLGERHTVKVGTPAESISIADHLPIPARPPMEPVVQPVEPPIQEAAPRLSDNWVPRNGYAIQGRVVDKETGIGISGAAVYALSWDNSFNQTQSAALTQSDSAVHAVSNPDGSFWLPDMYHGEYGLFVRHSLYVQDRPAYRQTVNTETMLDEVVLALEPGAVVLGMLSVEGTPLSNHPVTLKYREGTRESRTTQTNEEGRFFFEGLNDASILINTAYGQEERQVEALLRRGRTTIVDIPLSGFDSTIMGSITPYVPARDYIVTAVNDRGELFDAELYADGTYSFDQIPPATYRVEVQTMQWGRVLSKRDALLETHSNAVSMCDFISCDVMNVSGRITNLEQDETPNVYAVRSTMISALTTTVFNQLTKSPLATLAQLDEEGRFYFPDLEPGHYTLIARGQGERMGRVMLEVQDTLNTALPNYDEDVVAMQLDDSWTRIVPEDDTL